MVVRFAFLVWLLGCSAVSFAQADVVSGISFEGNKRTRESYLTRFVKTKVGQPLDSARLDADVQLLYNTARLINIHYEVLDSLAGKWVVIHLEEVWTLLPIMNFGGIKNNFWFELGATDIHFLGNGSSIGGIYRYYDRHNTVLWYRNPYVAGSNWGFSVVFTRNSTIEPLYFGDTSLSYFYDNYSAELLGRYEFAIGNFIQAGGLFLNEEYNRKDDVDLGAKTPESLTVNKYGFRVLHTFDRVNFFYQYQDGVRNVVTTEVFNTPVMDDLFWKVMTETSYYKRVRKRANMAFRLRLGLSSNADNPFAPFVLDSYLNIRGSGNRAFRGTSELVLNTEWRQTVFDHKLGAISTVVFLDWGGWRPAGDKLASTLYLSNMKAYAGGGIRLFVKKIYDLVLRLDYAFNLGDPTMHGPVIGVGQYF